MVAVEKWNWPKWAIRVVSILPKVVRAAAGIEPQTVPEITASRGRDDSQH